jgi:hypothetical protein
MPGTIYMYTLITVPLVRNNNFLWHVITRHLFLGSRLERVWGRWQITKGTLTW